MEGGHKDGMTGRTETGLHCGKWFGSSGYAAGFLCRVGPNLRNLACSWTMNLASAPEQDEIAMEIIVIGQNDVVVVSLGVQGGVYWQHGTTIPPGCALRVCHSLFQFAKWSCYCDEPVRWRNIEE